MESAVTALKQTLIGSGVLTDGYTCVRLSRSVSRLRHSLWSIENVGDFNHRRRSLTTSIRAYAYAAYAWACTLHGFHTMISARRMFGISSPQRVNVINPVLAAGQIEGGVAQAIGFVV